MTRVRLEVSYSETLLFSGRKKIVGIDPATLEKRIEIDFNTFAEPGSAAPDGRLFVADHGAKVGVWGEQVIVLDAQELYFYDILTGSVTGEPIAKVGYFCNWLLQYFCMILQIHKLYMQKYCITSKEEFSKVPDF